MPAAAALPYIAVALSAYSAYNGQKALGQQQDAQEQATKNAQTAADAATEANNKVNQKRPNSSNLLSSNQLAAKGGQSGTMLTGPNGIDPGILQLGKSTLLGG